jgi:hypothetical protein
MLQMKGRTAMRKIGFWKLTLFTLGLAVWLMTSMSATAEDNVSIKGSFGNSFSVIPTSVPEVFEVPVIGTGSLSHLGNITVSVSQFANFTVNPITTSGTMMVTVADGDQIFADSTGTVLFLPDGSGFANLDGTLNFTGGTGRFSGASGSATFSGLTHQDTPAGGTGLFTLKGHLSSPGLD